MQIHYIIPAATYVGCVRLIENIENAACVTVDLESCYKTTLTTVVFYIPIFLIPTLATSPPISF